MNLKDFRVKEIELDYEQSLEYDANHFFNGEFDGKVLCPLCSSTKGKTIHQIFKFHIIECECEFMYSFPRPTNEEQSNFYQQGKSNMLWHQVLSKTRENRKRNYVNNIVPLIGKHLGNKTNLVDIGCGKGMWLDAIREVFPQLTLFGVEPFADAETKAKYNIIDNFLENLNNQKEFDVCSLMSVIEHINDPLSCLKKCHQIIKDDGLMFITAPNMRGFDSLALEIKDRNWEIPQHINFFDMVSVKQCVEMAGFSIIESGTFGYLDVEIVSKTNKDLKNDFLNRLLTNKNNEEARKKFQKFLTDNGLSGQLYVVAKKS
jgi:2-polyprenyl-3-methyl-5-hydroxy-6-metoxy-1,4-benzoquinol methylase